jgi:Skp family chaperone for outer membrane proteins
MKIYRNIAIGAILASLVVLPAAAQTRPAATPASPPAQSTNPVPEGKIALIFSDVFQDPKLGIAKITSTMNALNREFQPRQTELNSMAQRIQTLQDEITKGQGTLAQKDLQPKMDQLDLLKKEYQRKGEDAQNAYTKRKAALFEPVQLDISNALAAYAKSHGIAVLIDGMQCLAYAADAIDEPASSLPNITAGIRLPRNCVNLNKCLRI